MFTTDTIQVCCQLCLDALGFVLSEDVFSRDPFPPFRASIKDGYAVIGTVMLHI
jgi:molybdopterin biosynthesis enzyme